MPLLTQEQIKEIIPHRDPFLLIDEVLEMEPGVRVVAQKYLKPDEFWFKGHFPQEPVQPGVLTIEMLAQAGAVCALSLPENKGKIAYFAGIDKAKFRQKIVPGDTIRLEVEIVKTRGPIGVGKAVASVNGKARRYLRNYFRHRRLKENAFYYVQQSTDCEPRRNRGAHYPRLPGAWRAHGRRLFRGGPRRAACADCGRGGLYRVRLQPRTAI